MGTFLYFWAFLIIMSLFLASLSVFVLNIPFGMWRAGVRKFSWQWFLSIHIPVPFVIAIRYLFDLGFQWHTYPFLVGAFFLGQLSGKKIAQKRNVVKNIKSSGKE